MIDNILAGIAIVANAESILALASGVLIGVIAGAIPGMSATMAVALTLPFTFSLSPLLEFYCCLACIKAAFLVDVFRRFSSKHRVPPPPVPPCSTAIQWRRKANQAEHSGWLFMHLALPT